MCIRTWTWCKHSNLHSTFYSKQILCHLSVTLICLLFSFAEKVSCTQTCRPGSLMNKSTKSFGVSSITAAFFMCQSEEVWPRFLLDNIELYHKRLKYWFFHYILINWRCIIFVFLLFTFWLWLYDACTINNLSAALLAQCSYIVKT